MTVPVQVVHAITKNVLLWNLAFPDLLASIHVLTQDRLHVFNPFRTLVAWSDFFQQLGEVFGDEDFGRGFSDHEWKVSSEYRLKVCPASLDFKVP
jgi:hypothetical protein